MAMNLNRRRGNKKVNIPLGSIGIVKDTSGKKASKDASQDIASVVITICESASYDQLFRKLPQESEYGKVAVYLIKPGQILGLIQRALSNEVIDKFTDLNGTAIAPNTKETLKKLKKDCEEAGADAVCFNFECCGGFTEAGFVQSGSQKYKDIYLDFVTFLATDFGCMTMFSDFSLKALIKDWDPNRLGPNPFKNTGQFGGDLEITFDPEQLKKCPSAQLNTVGSLSENGKAKLKAMVGTILFSLSDEAEQISAETTQLVGTQDDVDPLERKYLEPYEVEVLTVASMFSNQAFTGNKIKEVEEQDDAVPCEVNNTKGMAGHVLITFPPSDRNMDKYRADLVEEEEAKNAAIKEGKIIEIEDENEENDISPIRGMFLVSCGHWIELMKIDVNMDRLLKTVQKEWGTDTPIFQEMTTRYQSYTPEQQFTTANTEAVGYMQSRAPAKFNRKMVRKKKKGY